MKLLTETEWNKIDKAQLPDANFKIVSNNLKLGTYKKDIEKAINIEELKNIRKCIKFDYEKTPSEYNRLRLELIEEIIKDKYTSIGKRDSKMLTQKDRRDDYDIEIVETLSKTVSVKADSLEDAQRKVKKLYDNSQVILDSDNIIDTSFHNNIKIDERYKNTFVFLLPEEKQNEIKQSLLELGVSKKELNELMNSKVSRLESKININYKPISFKRSDLPDLCYIVLKTSGDLACVKNGSIGYIETNYNHPGDKSFNQKTADFMNSKLGVTKKQAAIMEKASCTNWNPNNKLLNPDCYDEMGKIVTTTITTQVKKNVRRLIPQQ